jgi:glycosyltransferase involved in cell wall biosynthesis
VIVPSRFVAEELHGLLGLDVEKLRVVAPGASVGEARETPVERVPQLGERPYVLAVGTDSARKNFALLDAIAPTLAREGVDVVIAGSRRRYLPQTDTPRVRRLGSVSEPQLRSLYAGAAALAMPSLYEGFGLPCIEAMAAGTPVVASDRSALPETCGDAATLVDPDDRHAFARALLQAALEPATRDRLVAAGRARATTFTWAATAGATDELIAGELAA